MPNPYTQLLDSNGWRLDGAASTANNGGGGPYARSGQRRDEFTAMRAVMLTLAELVYAAAGSGFNAGDNPYKFALRDLALKGLDNNAAYERLQQSWSSGVNW